MLVFQGCMACVVIVYYWWPWGADLLSRFARWQHSGGILLSSFITGLAGGVLSEVSLVYFQDKGRWTLVHLENMAFKFVLFFISGGAVYEFYSWQTVWFGEGTSWSVLVPKILVDQFIFTVFWSTPFLTLSTRWHNLRYSGPRLRRELSWDFCINHMLPILVTNWMFWLPTVALIYSMPSLLQTTLFNFGNAIWGLLLPTIALQGHSESASVTPMESESNIVIGIVD